MNPNGVDPAQSLVQPQPHNCSWVFDHGKWEDGKAFVRLGIMHAAGTTIVFLAADDAKRIAALIVDEATKAKAQAPGLIVPKFETRNLDEKNLRGEEP